MISGTADISDNTRRIRANGTNAKISSLNLGNGNFLSYPIYIGRRGGSTLPFNGRIYSLIVRFGSNLSDAKIEQTEEFVADKTGVKL